MQAGFIQMNPLGPHLYVKDDPTGGRLSDAVTDWFNHRVEDKPQWPGYEYLPAHTPIGMVLYEADGDMVEVFHPSLHDNIRDLRVPRREVGPQPVH